MKLKEDNFVEMDSDFESREIIELSLRSSRGRLVSCCDWTVRNALIPSLHIERKDRHLTLCEEL
jgi:hypothetical protein